MTDLTHLDAEGRARMVDVGGKPPMHRTAIAVGTLVAAPATLDRLLAGDLPKGEAVAVARVAGIQAAKRCDALIPLCHTLPLDAASIDFERRDPDRLAVIATAVVTARTGVEMEALTGASVALLTLWDMAKGVDPDLRIEDVRLIEKRKEPTA
ncbi:MAG: cyclic pyranopterin monophosphate synthase MoaC [Planctomycetaceae bacterium]|nr:cyclic pyranopterin monophosphate synthase MoaC [Planctomycetaceae bacterium]